MHRPRRTDLYGGRDPREIPAYRVGDASLYLRVPENTIRAWAFGRSYQSGNGTRQVKPVVDAADARQRLLSFVNVLEIHVLDAFRRYHHLDMKRIRAAMEYLEQKFGSRHPLVDHAMETDGVDVFVRECEDLINASRHGQLGMRVLLDSYLRRIERDDRGLAIRLYPFARKRGADPLPEHELTQYPRIVVMDPRIAFGRPVIAGTGIPTAEIADRFNAGESIGDLAQDYERAPADIEEAIRCEAA